MKSTYRDLIKHSGVYGIGQVITNLVSVAMLPIQTRFLSPGDLGVIAMLDLTYTVLGIVINGGLASAINRYHHDVTSEAEQHTVWWTGLVVALATTAVITIPAFFLRESIAELTLGPGERSGGWFYGLILVTLWFAVISNLTLLYFRIRKASTLIVWLSVTSLLVNVGINILLLTRGWGIAAVLVGNLITFIGFGALQLGFVLRSGARFSFDGRKALSMLQFAWPLLVTMLLATAMHQADRLLLRSFVDLDAVGVYSLAYRIGQGINSLITVPFGAIWGVAIYEIARDPQAKVIYARLFRYFLYVILLVMLGVSLFAEPILRLFAPPEYAAAAPLIPIVCLAFVFFSTQAHFQVPALLARRTISLVPPTAIAGVANVGLNLWLLPRFGAVAAAWNSVATYAIFAGINLLQNRRIDRYDYPLAQCGALMAGMIATVAAFHLGAPSFDGAIGSLLLPLALWTAWAVALLYPIVVRYAPAGPWWGAGTERGTPS